MKRFRETVYDHYRRNGRDLPWRKTRDPYRIVVSEVMLQQTQVSRVVEKYREFIRAFPTVGSLAAAPLRDVMAAWQGLGYNRRALLLKKLAAVVVSRYNGTIPRAREDLRTLPGIGDATSGSIRAFAFNEPDIFIETNIRSVYIHHFFRGKKDVSDERLVPYIERTLDRKDPRRWYNALMDYGVFLKERLPNPSRKSRHYTRQSPFRGSDRQIRGLILKELIAAGRLDMDGIYRRVDFPRSRVKGALEKLKEEGLIIQKGKHLTV